MFSTIIELSRLLTLVQRKELLVLQILVTLMAFAEIAGIASIGPFMALIGNIDILQQENAMVRIYKATGLQNPNDFIVWAGLTSLCVLLISAMISIFTIWRLSIFGRDGRQVVRILHAPAMVVSCFR